MTLFMTFIAEYQGISRKVCKLEKGLHTFLNILQKKESDKVRDFNPTPLREWNERIILNRRYSSI